MENQKGVARIQSIVDQEFERMVTLHRPIIDALDPTKVFSESSGAAMESMFRLIVRHAYVAAFASHAYHCIPAMHYDDVERFACVLSKYIAFIEEAAPKRPAGVLLKLSGMTDSLEALVEFLAKAGNERELPS